MRENTQTLAVVLAGGRVDELSVLTSYRPKSAVPFGGVYRIIDFALSNLMQSGLERIAILSQFRSFSLINHIGIGAAWDMLGKTRGISILPPSTGYGNTSWYKGSADAVFQNLDFIDYHDPEEILILSGDHVYNFDYRHLLDYHRQKDADLTMACLKVPMAKVSRFGVAEVDDEDGDRGGRVLRYKEKPDRPRFNWASMTIYCFKPDVLRKVLEQNASQDVSFEFGRDIIPRLLYEQRRIYAYKFKGYWGYSRTLEEFWQSNMDLLGANPLIDIDSWGLRTNLEHRDIRDSQPMKLGATAVVQDSLIYDGCVVDGTVERSILFPGVHIGKGSVVRDSVLFFNNVVKEECRLEKVISDVNVTIGRQVQIGEPGPVQDKELTLVGWNNTIPAGSRIGSDCIIFPRQEQEKFSRQIRNGEVVR